MNKEVIFAKLEGITNIPTLPVVVQALGKAIRDPNSDAAKIAAIVKDDPSMMARVLRVVNSAAYGLQRPVESVQQAISLIGLNAVDNIALSTAVFSTCRGTGKGGLNREELWTHAVSVGLAANHLCQRTAATLKKRYSRDILHLSGLLHDIGKILLAEHFQAELATAVARGVERQIPLWQAELQIYGTNHAEIGAWLARKWDLAADLTAVIRWHHEPEQAEVEHLDLLRIIHTANHICNLEHLGQSGDEFPSFVLGVWKRLGLGVKDIEAIVAGVREEAAKSETLLAIMRGPK